MGQAIMPHFWVWSLSSIESWALDPGWAFALCLDTSWITSILPPSLKLYKISLGLQNFPKFTRFSRVLSPPYLLRPSIHKIFPGFVTSIPPPFLSFFPMPGKCQCPDRVKCPDEVKFGIFDLNINSNDMTSLVGNWFKLVFWPRVLQNVLNNDQHWYYLS